VVAVFLGVVVGWVRLLFLCSLPFLRGWMASFEGMRGNRPINRKQKHAEVQVDGKNPPPHSNRELQKRKNNGHK